jgi:hypothetical protein
MIRREAANRWRYRSVMRAAKAGALARRLLPRQESAYAGHAAALYRYFTGVGEARRPAARARP